MVSGLEKVFFTSTLILISLNVIVSVKHSYTKCIILLVIGTWGYVVQTFQIPDLWLSIEKVTFLCYCVVWRKQCCETCVLSNGWTFLKYWEKKNTIFVHFSCWKYWTVTTLNITESHFNLDAFWNFLSQLRHLGIPSNLWGGLTSLWMWDPNAHISG